MFRDPHKILGVAPTASVDEIHAAFRRKARQHHPDLGGDRRQFQQLNNAYEQLLKQKEAEKLSPKKPASSTANPTQFTSSQENPYQSAPVQNTSTKTRKRKRDTSFGSSLKHLLTGKLPLQDQTTYFILVNALDIFLTYLHLRGGNHEANPIANFFFRNWNISGMIIFKLSIVASVCVIAQIVALSSLQKGSRLLNFGTVVIGCIVVYSIFLLAR